MAEAGDVFVGTLRDHDEEDRIPLSRPSSQDAAAGGAAPASPAEAAEIEAAGISTTRADDGASIDDDSRSLEARRRRSDGSLCTLQALADMCLSDIETDLDDDSDHGSGGALVPKVKMMPDRSTRSRSAKQKMNEEEKKGEKEAGNTGLGGTLRRQARRLSSLSFYSAAASPGDDDYDGHEDEGVGQTSDALHVRPAHPINRAFRRHSMPHVRSESSFGHLEQGEGGGGRAAVDDQQHSYYRHPGLHMASGATPDGRTNHVARRSSLPACMPSTISCYDARGGPTASGEKRRSSYRTAGSEVSGTHTDRHNDSSSSSSSRSILYDEDGGLGLLDGLEGLGDISAPRGALKQKISAAAASVYNNPESSTSSSSRRFLAQALAVAALAALCAFATVTSRTTTSGGASSNDGYMQLPSSFNMVQRALGVGEKPFASVWERMLTSTKDSGEGDTEQRNAAAMSPAWETDTERTGALMRMRRRRRWRRRWAWHQKGGNSDDDKALRQPTREGMKKFRAAVRIYKPRYFKWTRDVGQKGRAVCTFDSKEDDDDDNNNNNNNNNKEEEDNIFDWPAGKGKGKGKGKGYHDYHYYDDASDDFAVKNSKDSKSSKGSVRAFIIFFV